MEASRLIEAARAGQGGALDSLFAHYRNYLRFVARASFDPRLRRKADPSDAVQDALLRAHRGFAAFEGTEEPELLAWLRRILMNCLTDLDRRHRQAAARDVGRERSLERAVDHSSHVLQALLAVDQTTPSAHAERREAAVALADAIERLRPEDREVILLRNFHEWGWEEIGRSIGRTPGASRVLWTRALRKLGRLMEREP
jgi:RNA polymerase sigma-70 factor (ECF subfamily)